MIIALNKQPYLRRAQPLIAIDLSTLFMVQDTLIRTIQTKVFKQMSDENNTAISIFILYGIKGPDEKV